MVTLNWTTLCSLTKNFSALLKVRIANYHAGSRNHYTQVLSCTYVFIRHSSEISVYNSSRSHSFFFFLQMCPAGRKLHSLQHSPKVQFPSGFLLECNQEQATFPLSLLSQSPSSPFSISLLTTLPLCSIDHGYVTETFRNTGYPIKIVIVTIRYCLIPIIIHFSGLHVQYRLSCLPSRE